MHHHYRDITSRIDAAPLWWDECGVPRYCAFSPDETANIYATQCALVEIACQDCGHRFEVAFSWLVWEQFRHETPPLADRIRAGSLHYGDPPNAGCCAAGPTMNCEDLRVLQFWRRGEGGFDWRRDASLEVRLPDLTTKEGGHA